MRRRDFISLLGGAAVAWPLAAAAQQSTNSKRLAIFSPSEPSADLHEHSESKFSRALFAELRRLGQIEGQNLKVESYGREQNTSGPEALATEIVRSNPDVIFVVGPGAVIFKKLTSRIPIVVITGDPVKQGIAESLAHPGGNFTGVSIDAGLSIHGKRIALLREMVPTMSKLGCLALRLSMEWANRRSRNPRSGRNGRPPSRGVFSGIWYQRSRLSGGGREHLPRRCKCGHGRRFA